MTTRDTRKHFASSPCSLHEVDPGYVGLTGDRVPSEWQAWRGQQRQRLVAARMALAPDVRLSYGQRITMHLRAILEAGRGDVVGFYWPMRGEPDLRDLLAELVAAHVRCALPVVVARGEPLIYHSWAPGEPLTRGAWNIPVPAHGTQVTPDIVIAPVIGFDRHCYRLGYGGGYFDRTLAVFHHQPRAIGVGYSIAELPSIHPQPHDIAMHMMVTEQGVR